MTAALVSFAGVVNLVSVALPVGRDRFRLLAGYVPGALVTTATAATAAAGVGLLLLAGGLRRRRRSALLATVALLLGGAVLHLLKGLDLEVAVVEAFLGGLLVGKADRFAAHAGPNERRPVLRPAVAVVALTFGVGLLALLANRHSVDGQLTLATATWEVGSLAVGQPGPLGLDGWFARVFPVTVMATFLAGAGLLVLRLLGPALARRRPDPELGALVADSDDSLAYFALRDDRSSVRAGGALVSYGVAGTVALACGGPRGPDRPAKLAPGDPGRVHLPGVARRRPRRGHRGRVAGAVAALARPGGRARLLDGARAPVRPPRPAHPGGRRPRRRRPAPRLPALRALGGRRRQPGRNAPRPPSPWHPQRLPGRRGRPPPPRAWRPAGLAELLLPARRAGNRCRARRATGAAAATLGAAPAVQALPDRVAVPLQQEVRPDLAAPPRRPRSRRGPAPRRVRRLAAGTAAVDAPPAPTTAAHRRASRPRHRRAGQPDPAARRPAGRRPAGPTARAKRPHQPLTRDRDLAAGGWGSPADCRRPHPRARTPRLVRRTAA